MGSFALFAACRSAGHPQPGRTKGSVRAVRRYDLIDELIAEVLVDHVDIPGVEGTGRDRYLLP